MKDVGDDEYFYDAACLACKMAGEAGDEDESARFYEDLSTEMRAKGVQYYSEADETARIEKYRAGGRPNVNRQPVAAPR